MRYRITHTTHYRYSTPVRLQPHIIKLCPRSDGSQWLNHFEASLSPEPTQQHYCLDVCGNTSLQVTFQAPLEHWSIKTISEVTTQRENPFDYLSEPWAVELPIDYPSRLASQLRPYWKPPMGIGVDDAASPTVLALAQELQQAVKGNVGYFLTRLTQQIPARCEYQQRQEGMPHPAAVTWQQKLGSCRDFTVLFIAVCRAVGLAARFVSGYQEGDLESDAPNDLHAWAEVYIPGGGWRGFDPTLGLAVADRHIAIAAATTPQEAAPVIGKLRRTTETELYNPLSTSLDSHIHIEALGQ